MKFDDGFSVWLNGSLVASNLPGTNLAWNALAAGSRDDYLNDAWASFTIPCGLAVQGTNLLAFQVFNASTSSSDLLLLPELDAVYPATSTNAVTS